MKLYEIHAEVLLPMPLEETFSFFADAHNLERITPEWLQFNVLTPKPIAMRVGTHIDYKLRVRCFPIHWQSEITAWQPPHRFVDEQLKGPYRRWIHEHIFCQAAGQTLAKDSVRYAVPGGGLVHWLVVKSDVERIFEYRKLKLQEIFATPKII